MKSNSKATSKFEMILTTALKLPGVKVDRNDFLRKELIQYIPGGKVDEAVNSNTIKAEIDMVLLDKISKKLINRRTNQTASASFLAGLPGGLAMAATIPADMVQFYGVALRTAQEIAYLYGFEDLWKDDNVDKDKVKNELILFLGVMFGISGATMTLRLISTNLSKQVIEKLPQKQLSKTIYYPIIKKICSKIGIKITNDTFAKGVSKVIPFIGGVISGGITYLSMKPMASRLKDEIVSTINKNYTLEDFKNDVIELERETGQVLDIKYLSIV